MAKYAYATLLMMSNSYLPGVMLLGEKLKKINGSVDRVCLVTKEVTEEARKLISTLYIIQEIKEWSVPKKFGYAFHKDTFEVYRRTFTKIGVLLIKSYDKILFVDADMIPTDELLPSGNHPVVDIFNLPTPTGVYMGYFSIWDSKDLPHKPGKGTFIKTRYEPYKKLTGKNPYDGQQLHKYFYQKDMEEVNALGAIYLGTETSVFMVQPNEEEYNRLYKIFQADLMDLEKVCKVGMSIKDIDAVTTKRRKLSGDTSFLAIEWRDKWHSMDEKYIGRWKTKDVYFVDSYGNAGKPWEDKVNASYPDVKYWRDEYKKYISSDTAKRISVVRRASTRQHTRQHTRPGKSSSRKNKGGKRSRKKSSKK
jgi:alpha-N-acetylglucosamine transferase